jgi:hypothetical protein
MDSARELGLLLPSTEGEGYTASKEGVFREAGEAGGVALA